MTNTNYGIDTGDGNQLTTGLQGYDHARKVAQRIADERGESVWLYEDPSAEDSESEEVTPTQPRTVQEIANEYGVGSLVSGAPSDGSSPATLATKRAMPRDAARTLVAAFAAAGHEADDVLDADDDAMAWVYVTPAQS